MIAPGKSTTEGPKAFVENEALVELEATVDIEASDASKASEAPVVDLSKDQRPDIKDNIRLWD